jgi:pyrroline-5-carboxylate reductase
MGGALFSGWCKAGLAPSVLVDPSPAPGIARPEDTVVHSLTQVPLGFAAEIAVLAIKPQMADDVMPAVGALMPPGSVVLSIMAGRTLAGISASTGGHRVVRAMPNTPAAIGQGMTVACAGADVTGAQRDMCDRLLRAVGDVAWLADELLMDTVSAISGSGPAYFFLLAELLEESGILCGLPPDLSRLLARRTLTGAAALLTASDEDAADLRRAVTSPKGMTEAALAVLMAPPALPGLLTTAVRAAIARAKALAGDV